MSEPRQAVEIDLIRRELIEALHADLTERPQRCGHASDPMCCPVENFPELARFFDDLYNPVAPLQRCDRCGVLCEPGYACVFTADPWQRDAERPCRPPIDAVDGQANTCGHLSATGIDTAPVGPGKVWRCDHCGLTYRDEGDGQRAADLVKRPGATA